MKNKNIYFGALLAGILISAVSCSKDSVTTPEKPVVTTTPISFVEEFDNVGTITAKGWVIKNNSIPIGQNGWRQGRYEASTGAQYKFLAPVPFYGFPAYSASASPNDFISCDVTAGNDAAGATDISAWLISPSLPLKNGDQIIFYTRAVADQSYSVYTKDRMQVRANYTDGTANVGNSSNTLGSFTNVLLDINSVYDYNDPAGTTTGLPGYPQDWTKYTITLSGIPNGSVTNGRFAFRYLATDAGVFGGSAGANYPTVVGIDSLAYIHK